MKRFYPIFLIVLACSFCSAPAAHAQFWKKIFKKEHRKKDKEREKHKKEQAPAHIFSPKKETPQYPSPVKKGTYRIDVLLPLHLNQLVQNGKAVYKRQPDYVLPTIHFYEGLKIAADTLNGLGYKIDLYVHDITDPADNIPHLLSDTSFAHTDLVIGLLQSENIPAIAAFAKANHVNFLSALSPSDAGIEDNPYFILVQPTLSTHIQQLTEYALDKYRRQPKFLFYKKNTGVQKEAHTQLEDALKGLNITSVDCSKALPPKDSLIKLFDSTVTNVVFMNIFSPSLVEPVLKTLAGLGPSYRFAIFGMPSWKVLPGLSQPGYYGTLSIFYTNPFYFERNSRPGTWLNAVYKDQHGAAAPEMAFRGYETLYWMVSLLEKYGSPFNKDIDDISAAPFTRYKIKDKWSEQNDFLYMENQHLNIFKYQNGYFTVN
jgi:hypothetical protein